MLHASLCMSGMIVLGNCINTELTNQEELVEKVIIWKELSVVLL